MSDQMIQVVSQAEAKTRLLRVGAKLVRKVKTLSVYQTRSGAIVQLVQLDDGKVRLTAARGCDC